MIAGQNDQRRRRGHGTSGKRSSGSLVAHGAFAPLLGLWGAALGGLGILVLPEVLIAMLVAQTLLAPWSAMAQPLLASLAALALGGALFVIAAAMTRRARRRTETHLVSHIFARQVRPINPTRDLGSRSLDDPVETIPFATPAWRVAPTPAEQELPEPALAPEPAPESEPDLPAPVALDLAQFAELPGRNAVWVEEQPAPAVPAALAEPASAPVAYTPVSALRAPTPPPTPSADPSAAALARLRAVPPSELSLAEMVERFAGALKEQRSAASGKALSAQELAARDAALADALKALAALSGSSSGPVQAEPLRAALARLQGQRGAA